MRFKKYLPIIIIFAVSFAVYSNTFKSPFHYDDEMVIQKNEDIRDIRDLRKIFTSNSSRPVLTLSFAMNYWYGKLDPFLYHLINIFLHSLNGVLIFLILSLTFPGNFFYSLFPSILFVSHPINTESVTYISSRSGVLCATFYLLSMLYFIKFLKTRDSAENSALLLKKFRTGASPVPTLFYSISIISFILGIGVKEVGITLPFALILYEFCLFTSIDRRGFSSTWLTTSLTPSWRDKNVPPIMNKCIYYIPFFTIIGIVIILRKYFYGTFGNPEFHRDYYKNFLTQARVVWTYIKLLFFPVNLNVDHEFVLSNSLFEFTTLLSFAGILILCLAAFLIFKRSPAITFCIFFFFLNLAPTLLIPLQDLVSERWLYLPAIGFYLFLSLFFERAFSVGAGVSARPMRADTEVSPYKLDHLIIEPEKALSRASSGANKNLKKTAVNIIGVILVLFFAVLTLSRNAVWSSELSLWKDAALKSPNKARTHNNLGVAFAKLKRYNEAIDSFKEAIKIDNHYSPAMSNLGRAYRKTGKKDLMLQEALDLFESGEYYVKKGMLKEAIKSYMWVIDLAPDSSAAHGNLGMIYMLLGEKELAKGCFEKVLKYEPQNKTAKRFLKEIGRDGK